MFYFQNEFSSVAVARRLHLNVCQRCGSEFAYEVFRIGQGSGTSVYGLNNDGAEDRAHRRALANAFSLAEKSPEVVPCPKCDHIAEEMVDEWGRGTMGGLLFCGTIAIVLGVTAATFGGIFLKFPPRRNPPSEEALWVLFGCGIAVIALGIAMILLRSHRLRTTRPVPGPHTAQRLLDLGYMPALLVGVTNRDAVSLAPARPVVRQMADGAFIVPVLKALPPAACLVCLEPVNTGGPDFALCRQCTVRQRVQRLRIVLPVAIVFCTLLWLMVPTDAWDELARRFWWFLIMPGISLLVGFVIAVKLRRSFALKRADAIRGVCRIEGASQGYFDLLSAHYSKTVDYQCEISHAQLAELREEARERLDAPRPSKLVRFWRRVSAAMNTEFGTR